jgi:serine/threonine-protein kinase RsbW
MTARSAVNVEAKLENVPELRRFVTEVCEEANIPAGVTHDLQLAVDEACTNIVLHGYAGQEAGRISLSFHWDSREVVITISDSGHAFDPRSFPEPDLDAAWEARQVGGLGVHLIRHLVDGIRYETDDQLVNHLTLVKTLRGGAFLPEEQGRHHHGHHRNSAE